MCNSRAHVSRELPSICPNPLWDLFAEAVWELAYYRGMNPLKWLPHFGFALLFAVGDWLDESGVAFRFHWQRKCPKNGFRDEICYAARRED